MIEDAGIKEMREGPLYPTVTSIIGGLANPYLERWKTKNAVGIALELTPEEREGEPKEVIDRVIEASRQTAIEAADRGTEIHHGAEAIMQGRDWNEDDPQLVALKEWADANITRVDFTEKVLVDHDLKVGGTCDLKAEHQKHGPCLFDYKSQNCKAGPNGKPRPNYYTSFLLQLSMYAEIVGGDIPVVSVIIDKNSPTIFEKRWPDEKVAAAFQAFKSLHQLWCWQNNYYPDDGLPDRF